MNGVPGSPLLFFTSGWFFLLFKNIYSAAPLLPGSARQHTVAFLPQDLLWIGRNTLTRNPAENHSLLMALSHLPSGLTSLQLALGHGACDTDSYTPARLLG